MKHLPSLLRKRATPAPDARLRADAATVSTLDACCQLLADQDRKAKVSRKEALATAVNALFEQLRP